MTEEQLAALRAMPVWLRPGGSASDGTLPDGAPSARVINELQARGLIQLINGGARHRWALTPQGQAELARWTRS